MPGAFTSFVIFCGMRTGSNFLEASLNEVPGLTCHGEAFNPYFVGWQGRDSLLGHDLKRREGDPSGFLARLRAQPGLNGFRYFHDHDARVLDGLLDDPRCAKIILTRNPADSFISRRIAGATGQWKITRARDRSKAGVSFDAAAFETHLSDLQGFYLSIIRALQTRGQTAFHIAYEDLGDIDVLNGLLAWLGLDHSLDAPSRAIVRQNPEGLAETVSNLPEMEQSLARLDLFNLARIPNLEPRRGPAVPGFVAARGAPLLHLPVRCGPEASVREWLSRIGAAASRGTDTEFTRNSLRRWMQDHPGHRKFTVLTHPALRAFRAYRMHILSDGYADLRATLRSAHDIDLPEGTAPADLRRGFAGYLSFVRMNLDGQTGLRTDPIWASQTALLDGFAQLCHPDAILREDRLDADLAVLAASVGAKPPPVPAGPDDSATLLAAIWDADLEKAVHAAYRRDYLNFGFAPYAA